MVVPALLAGLQALDTLKGGGGGAGGVGGLGGAATDSGPQTAKVDAKQSVTNTLGNVATGGSGFRLDLPTIGAISLIVIGAMKTFEKIMRQK